MRLRPLPVAAAGVAAVALLAAGLRAAEQPAQAPETPLLARYGCDTCHGPGAPFHARLRASADRGVDELVERILHADRFDARRRMPVYAGTISEARARELAAEAQAVGRALRAGEEGSR